MNVIAAEIGVVARKAEQIRQRTNLGEQSSDKHLMTDVEKPAVSELPP